MENILLIIAFVLFVVAAVVMYSNTKKVPWLEIGFAALTLAFAFWNGAF